MAIYLIDKQPGITSQDAVSMVKRNTKASKAGHSGTLDPFATGLLIVATEGHTRLLDRLLAERKTYSGVIAFGQTTETLDPEGKMTTEAIDKVELADVISVINEKFKGVISQRPPMYSSIKVNGVKAYDRARAGEVFELEPVKRTIYSFEIEEESENKFRFKVEVSSGTYIRALARDLAKEFGTVGMLTELRREKIGSVSVDDAGTTEEPKTTTVHKALLLPELEVTEIQMKMLLQGKDVKITLDKQYFEFIAMHGEDELLVKERSARTYKIVKRIK